MTVAFKINTPKVVHEIIDGEVVVINLDTGLYYSLTKVGADIWSQIDAGQSQPAICATMVDQYEGPQETISLALDSFIQDLQREELIVLQSAEVPQSSPGFSDLKSDLKTVQNGGSPGEKLPFEAPKVERYTDMQDLLLLDPIHEVDETGWPSIKAG
jgi:hypothetical protein